MFRVDRIKTIIKVTKALTYDITVEKDHSFICIEGGNGLVSKNSSCRHPNFQNVPSHGAFAKLIKRQFIPEKGCIYFKSDLNAAEVRGWANVSQDQKLADVFRVGVILRKKLFLETNEELKAQIKKDIKGKGDVHRLNFSFFYGKAPEEVTDEERNKVKAVIFGVIYGKGKHTLAKDLEVSEQQAQELLDKLFGTYVNGGLWIQKTKELAKQSLIVSSPIGRIRHLGSYLHPKHTVRNDTDRKATNSCIQGLSSDGGYQGGRIFDSLIYNLFTKKGLPLYAYQNNTVHDSVEGITKFEHLPITLYLLEHSFTTLVINKYKDLFGFNVLIEPEVESEIGSSMGALAKFDWRELPQRIVKELDEAEAELGYSYTVEEKKEILRKFNHNYDVIMKVKEYEVRKYLTEYDQGKTKIFDWCVLMDADKAGKMIERLIF